MLYIGLIHKDTGSEYGVSFPDFPGCVTAGVSLEEARVMAQEALTLHVEGMLEDGEAKLFDPIVLHHIKLGRERSEGVGPLGHEIRIAHVRPFAGIRHVHAPVVVSHAPFPSS